MKTVKLRSDHRRWVNGKVEIFKKGETISVSYAEYEQIVLAVQESRATLRQRAESLPGSPEYNRIQR